ncbi:MAG: 23S rRNA (pseudouridine(1915)-N(3))-methyltransferase RlmH [Bacillota bacterium]|nr:23S rRNA (pseudouridine(1915)-N(3))-methyltransferase RlmH [Bacillota bacterium]
MQVRIVAVGTLREPHWRAAAREYLKRLQPYARVEVVEVKEEPLPEMGMAAEEAAARRREGERILTALAKPPRAHVIALDVHGQELSSEELAEYLAKLSLEGQSSVAFVIGGASGLAPEVLTAADFRFSLSRLTLPHQLARVVLLEQLYRAFKIIRREPYHR